MNFTITVMNANEEELVAVARFLMDLQPNQWKVEWLAPDSITQNDTENNQAVDNKENAK